MLNPSDNPPEQPHRLEFLQKLLYSHPLAFWGGLWAVMVLVGSIAAVGLLNPGPIEQEASQPTPTLLTIQESVAKPEPSKKPKPSPKKAPKSSVQEDKQDLPLSLFGVVALGCAAGSLFVTQALRQSTQSYPSSKRTKPAATVRKKRRRPAKKSRPASRMPQPDVSQFSWQTQNNQPPMTDEQFTQVTVLPPEESNPLDWDQESLADMMDLRKRQSLSSLMRTNNPPIRRS